MDQSTEHRILHTLFRRPLDVVATIYLVALVWGGLVPFDFVARPVQPFPLTTLHAIAAVPLHLPDVIANIGLFVIAGLFLRAALRRRWPGMVLSFFASVAIAGLVSLFIETAQAYSVLRDSSALDLVANMVGAALGAASYGLAHGVYTSIIGVGRSTLTLWGERARKQPSGVLAQLCAAGIAFASLAPFDFAISVNRLVESARDTTLVPFGRTSRLGESVWPTGELARSVSKHAARDHWQLWLDYAWVLIAYAMLAVLVMRYLTRHCATRGWRAYASTVAACAMLALAIAFGQVLIMSRSADVTCLLLAAVAGLAGALLSEAVVAAWAPARTNGGPFAPHSRRKFVAIALTGVALYIGARQMAPFDFDTDSHAIAAQLRTVELTPMRMYQTAKLPVALDDIVHKALRWTLLAGILCLWRRHRGMPDRRQPVFLTASYGAALMLVAEMVQLTLPARNPAITDVVLAGVMSGAGVVAFRLVATALTLMGILRPVETEQVLFNVEIPPPSDVPRERVVPPATGRTARK